MKKGIMIGFVTAALLTMAQADGVERSGHGWMGMSEMQEHMDTVQHEEQSSFSMSSANSQEMEDMGSSGSSQESNATFSSPQGSYHEGLEHAGQAYSSVMSGAGDAHSSAMAEASSTYANQHRHGNFLEVINFQLPKAVPHDIKEAIEEARKAVKFFKHPELFEDINVTDIANLDPQTIEEIKKRAQKAKEEREKWIAQRIIQNRSRVKLPIAGDFVRIGDGQYDWVFVTKNGKVFKLAGVNEEGNFKYEPLPGAKAVINANGEVKFLQTGGLQLAQTQLPGYPFVKYGDETENGFDWVVVVGGKVYKLEGFDEDSKSFIYTPAQGLQARQQGDEVDILPGSNG